MTLEARLVSYDWDNQFHSFQEATMKGSFKPLCWTAQSTLLPVSASLPNVHIEVRFSLSAFARSATYCWLILFLGLVGLVENKIGFIIYVISEVYGSKDVPDELFKSSERFRKPSEWYKGKQIKL